MYQSIDAVGVATAAAAAAVMADRRRYEPFFEAAERLAAARALIVGGDTATRMLLGAPLGPGDYFYVLHSTRALDDARALADALHRADPAGLGRLTHMDTTVPRREFALSVDERVLFQVRALDVHRGARAADIIVPAARPAYFARGPDGAPLRLLCMGADVQLLSVYAALTNPARAKEWPALLEAEESLRALYLAEAGAKAQGIGRRADAPGADDGDSGDSDEPDDRGDEKCGGGAAVKRRGAAVRDQRAFVEHAAPGRGGALQSGLRRQYFTYWRFDPAGAPRAAPRDASAAETLAAVLAKEFVPRAGHVAVGRFAAGAPGARIQLVTENTFAEEEQMVARIASRLGLNVQSTNNEPKVPTDDRLRRLTMYVLTPGERRMPFLDIFNAGGHELIPFVRAAAPGACGGADLWPGAADLPRADLSKMPRAAGRRGRARRENAAPACAPAAGAPAGSPFVRLRFVLVDVWTIQLLWRMGFATEQYTRQVLRELQKDFEAAAADYLARRAAGDFESIFPTGAGSYIGRYVDPVLHQKRERFGRPALGARRAFFPPYFPARAAAAAAAE